MTFHSACVLVCACWGWFLLGWCLFDVVYIFCLLLASCLGFYVHVVLLFLGCRRLSRRWSHKMCPTYWLGEVSENKATSI